MKKSVLGLLRSIVVLSKANEFIAAVIPRRSITVGAEQREGGREEFGPGFAHAALPSGL